MIDTQEPLELDCSLVGLMQVINQTAGRGEPILMADWAHIMISGRPVCFEDGTRGMIGREVSRAEYIAWKDRLFPGLPAESPNCSFFEVLVD